MFILGGWEWCGNMGWDAREEGGKGNPAWEKGKAGTREGTEEAGLTGSLDIRAGGRDDFMSSAWRERESLVIVLVVSSAGRI